MFSQVLGMGAAAIPLLRNVIEQTGANGASRVSEEKPAPGGKQRT
jgi:cytochrome c oxidase assembly protein Cox11